MNTKALRQKILDLAIHGKLVPQDPNDEQASVLLDRIRVEKERLVKEGKIKRAKKPATSDKSPYGKDAPWALPQGWAWTTLGEVGKWQAGGTPSRSNKAYFNGDIPWLKTGDLNDGYITHIPEYITQEALDNSSAKLNPAGSVLIAMYGATIGKVGILTFPATTNQACCACIEYQKAIEQKYLFYFLIASKQDFIMRAGGGAQPNISKDIIVQTPIALPPLNEQKRIVEEVERLNALVDNIEENQSDLAATITHAKARILDLAIHGKLVQQDPKDEPAEALLRRINPKWEPSDNPHYPFDIPNGWSWAKMADISTLERGGNFVKGDFVDDGYPCIHYGQIHTKFSFKTFDAITFISEDKASKQRKAHPNDIVMAITSENMNDVCKCTAWLGQYDVAVGAHAAIIRHHIDSMYLTYFFYSTCFAKQKEDIAHGSKVIEISPIGISSFQIPIPPLKEQQRIVAAIEKTFATLDTIQFQLKA